VVNTSGGTVAAIAATNPRPSNVTFPATIPNPTIDGEMAR
jgi:hypothetical protein